MSQVQIVAHVPQREPPLLLPQLAVRRDQPRRRIRSPDQLCELLPLGQRVQIASPGELLHAHHLLRQLKAADIDAVEAQSLQAHNVAVPAAIEEKWDISTVAFCCRRSFCSCCCS